MIPRTLYVDPGTARTAWLVAERADPAQDLSIPLRAVGHDKIETGSLVDLPADKVTVRQNGSIKDKKRVVFRADRIRVAGELAEIAKRHGARRAVIEMMGHVYLHGSDAAKIAQAEAARQMAKLEEKIIDLLEDAGVEVVQVKRVTWANRLRIFLPNKVTGSVSMTRAELLPILQTGYDNAWPTAAGEDERDCGGISLWDVLPPLVSKRKAGTGQPRKRTSGPAKPRGPRGEIDKAKHRLRRLALAAERRPAHEAALLAARVAAGCNCGAHRGRHKATCPCHREKPLKPEAAELRRRRVRLAVHDRACDG